MIIFLKILVLFDFMSVLLFKKRAYYLKHPVPSIISPSFPINSKFCYVIRLPG